MAFSQINSMKADISGLISEWGIRSSIKRLSGSLNASKRFSGSFITKSSGLIWIQPDAGNYRRGEPGQIEETTHVAFASKTLNVVSGDRILPSGDSYEYDVLDIQENPTHNAVMLRRVKR